MMERNQELFETIERYLANECTPEQKKDFENRINQYPELKKEVNLHRSLHSEFQDINSLEFRTKLQQISIGLKEKKNIHLRKWRPTYMLKVAAVAVVLIGISAYLWIQSESKNVKLYESYYYPFPVSTPLRGNNGSDAMEHAMFFYSNKYYYEAIKTLKNIEVNDPYNPVIQLYLGNSFLNISENQQAILSFKKVDKESQYYEHAQWYLALTYLKMGKFEDARNTLNNVINYNGVHKKNAETLFDKLMEIQ